jgi:hypothetical protein
VIVSAGYDAAVGCLEVIVVRQNSTNWHFYLVFRSLSLIWLWFRPDLIAPWAMKRSEVSAWVSQNALIVHSDGAISFVVVKLSYA